MGTLSYMYIANRMMIIFFFIECIGTHVCGRIGECANSTWQLFGKDN